MTLAFLKNAGQLFYRMPPNSGFSDVSSCFDLDFCIFGWNTVSVMQVICPSLGAISGGTDVHLPLIGDVKFDHLVKVVSV